MALKPRNTHLDYQFLFGIFIRAKNITGFINPLVGIAAYSAALLFAILNSVAVIVFVRPVTVLEYVGKDTLPLYMSHGIIYYILGLYIEKLPMGAGFFVICCATLISVYVFSLDVYRSTLSKILSDLKKWLFSTTY